MRHPRAKRRTAVLAFGGAVALAACATGGYHAAAPDTVLLPAPPPDTVYVTFEPEGDPDPEYWARVEALREAVRDREKALETVRRQNASSEAALERRQVELRVLEAELRAMESRPPRPTAIDSILAGLDRGNTAFRAPSRMEVGERAVVTLVLGPGRREVALEASPGAEVERSADVPISNRMEAVLSGSAFTIHPQGEAVQAVSGVLPTTWSWEIVAGETGKAQPLTVTLTLLVEVEGERSARRVTSMESSVEVFVSAPAALRAFLADNYEWLWGAVLVPFLLWLRRRLGKKRESTAGLEDVS